MANESLPPELVPTKRILTSNYKKRGYKVSPNEHIDDEKSYQFHLLCKKNYETIAIEIRNNCSIESYFESRIDKFHQKRLSVKIYIATPAQIEGDDLGISFAQQENFEKKGIGLLVVKDKNIKEVIGTVSCIRRFVIEEGSSLGNYSSKVNELVTEYNKGKCVSAIRELSEQVEQATYELATKAAKKGKINVPATDIVGRNINWETIINILSTSEYKGVTQTKYFDKEFSNYIKPFKDVRNISDHWKDRKKKNILDRRLPTAMGDGVQILRELIKIKSKV